MTHTHRTLRVGMAVFLGLMLLAGSTLAVGIQGAGGTTNPYGYYNPSGSYGSAASSCSPAMPYGIAPHPQQPISYCMYWRPPQWIPVQVMIPGRWETRPVWIPGQQATLYRPIPGYWQRTDISGAPDVSVYRTQNGWQATPYQPQTSSGYFDSQGVWRPEK